MSGGCDNSAFSGCVTAGVYWPVVLGVTLTAPLTPGCACVLFISGCTCVTALIIGCECASLTSGCACLAFMSGFTDILTSGRAGVIELSLLASPPFHLVA